MSTRKLILAALLCGLAIMLAGGIKLFQTVSSPEVTRPLGIGTTATLGDMSVSVDEITVVNKMTIVTVTMSGVEGADAEAGWGLFVTGDSEIHSPMAVQSDAQPGAVMPCRGLRTTAAQPVTCHVYFMAQSDSSTVIYKRATLTQRWSN